MINLDFSISGLSWTFYIEMTFIILFWHNKYASSVSWHQPRSSYILYAKTINVTFILLHFLSNLNLVIIAHFSLLIKKNALSLTGSNITWSLLYMCIKPRKGRMLHTSTNYQRFRSTWAYPRCLVVFVKLDL